MWTWMELNKKLREEKKFVSNDYCSNGTYVLWNKRGFKRKFNFAIQMCFFHQFCFSPNFVFSSTKYACLWNLLLSTDFESYLWFIFQTVDGINSIKDNDNYINSNIEEIVSTSVQLYFTLCNIEALQLFEILSIFRELL